GGRKPEAPKMAGAPKAADPLVARMTALRARAAGLAKELEAELRERTRLIPAADLEREEWGSELGRDLSAAPALLRVERIAATLERHFPADPDTVAALWRGEKRIATVQRAEMRLFAVQRV